MRHDLRKLAALADYRLQVEFLDGSRGVFDLRPYLDSPGMDRLRDPSYFQRVSILVGAANWPSGEDIAPETLAAEVATNVPT